uniref:DC_STAMP domain-containing protein n=1 Tax=Strongyloides venezuelensis TaxID=75913 RepID=A0A0K0FWZ1_STRVS
MDNLISGPITNIGENFKQTATGFTCFAALQKNVTEERFTLAAGPLEHFLQENIAKGIKISRKIINTIKVILQPFKDEVEEKTEEDELTEKLKLYKTTLEEREMLKNDVKEIIVAQDKNATDSVLKYSKLRTKLVNKMAKRIDDRCMEIFRSVTYGCVRYLNTARDLCFDKLPKFISNFLCVKLSQDKFCSNVNETETKKKCDNLISNSTDSLFPPTFDQEIGDFKSSAEDITDEMAIVMHMKRITGERKTNVKLMGQLTNMIHSEIHYMEIAIESMKEFGNLNYLNEIEFENNYYTWYFWKIDVERFKSKKSYLYPLTNAEVKINNIRSVFSKPITKEKKAMKLPFISWIVLTCLVVGITVADHYFYRVLSVVNGYGNVVFATSGSSKIALNITGEGVFVDWLRDMLAFNYTRESNSTVTTNFCNKQPYRPKYMDNFISLGFP